VRLKSIHIKNLKSIKPDLKIDFERDRAVTLLYGYNGVGKTTVLEAISLLGHVSTMRRIYIDKDPDPEAVRIQSSQSCFRDHLEAHHKSIQGEDLRLQFRTPAPPAASVLEAGEPSRRSARRSKPPEVDAFDKLSRMICPQGLWTWFKATEGDNPSLRDFGVVKYDLHLEPDEGGELSFIIAFFQKKTSITHALSRDARDKLRDTRDNLRVTGDDLDMEKRFAVIASPSERVRLELYITGLCEASPHTVREGEDEVVYERSKGLPKYGIVSYINTDLNNFGQKNDLRESVKNLGTDFNQEIFKRLGIPFNGLDEDGRPGYCLNSEVRKDVIGALDRVLRDAGGAGSTFKFEYCRICDGKLHFGTVHPDGTKHSITFMSAGENECFFVFLLLFGMPIKNSIILLDEPDLHMSPLMKRRFFDEVYRRLRAERCQVVLATHSPDAYRDSYWLDPRYMRSNVTTLGAVKYECAWDKRKDVVMLQERHLKTALGSFGGLRLRSGLRLAARETFWMYEEWFNRRYAPDSAGAGGANLAPELAGTLRDHVDWWRMRRRLGGLLVLSLVLVIAVGGVGAFVWDVLTMIDKDLVSEHTDKLWGYHKRGALLSTVIVLVYHACILLRAADPRPKI
jgi:predicted ATPase